MKKRTDINTHIRTLYAPEFASVMMHFYNTYFAFCFAEWVGKDRNYGTNQYDTKNTMRTTVNYEGAMALYLVGISILDRSTPPKATKLVLLCNNNTTLTLEFNPDEDSHGYSYLSITKNNRTISLRFQTHTYKTKENGVAVVKVIQSGLGAFIKTIEGYLVGVNADGHLSELPENLLETITGNQDPNDIILDTTEPNKVSEKW